MKIQFPKNGRQALTRIELLIILAVLLLLAAMLLPALRKAKARSSRIGCPNILKQVGLAFRVWEGDNNDKYPMSVSVTNGGTVELVESGVVWRHFQAMSNELNTPKILFCPNESGRAKKQANTWEPLVPGSLPELVQFASNTNTSYFIGVDATDTIPTMFLAGDRNLTVGGAALKPGLHSISTNQIAGWTKELHVNQGNVLMADGSVQSFTQSGLQQALSSTGASTNRLAVP